jgi:hypothetical protein
VIVDWDHGFEFPSWHERVSVFYSSCCTVKRRRGKYQDPLAFTVQPKNICMISGRVLLLTLHSQSKECNLCAISKYLLVDKAHLPNNSNSGIMKFNYFWMNSRVLKIDHLAHAFALPSLRWRITEASQWADPLSYGSWKVFSLLQNLMLNIKEAGVVQSALSEKDR